MRMMWAFRLCLVLICAGLIYRAVEQSRITIAAGPVGGGFDVAAHQYQDILGKAGLSVTVTNRENTLSIPEDINDPNGNVDLGFTAGKVDGALYPNAVSLGSIFYEPVFIFYQKSLGSLHRIDQLKGLRLAIAPAHSGTRAVADLLLALYGVDTSNSTLLPLTFDQAGAALAAGQADAAFYLLPAESGVIRKLAAAPNLALMSLDQAEAIAHRLDFVEPVRIPMGSWDLIGNQPPETIVSIAATATVIARKTLNKAVTYEVMKALKQSHDGRGIISYQGEFPSAKDRQLKMAEAAEDFLKNGLSFIHRELPYWLATVFDSFFVYLVSFALVFIPMVSGSRTLRMTYYMILSRFIYERRLRRIAARLAQDGKLAEIDIQYARMVYRQLTAFHADPTKRCEGISAEILKTVDAADAALMEQGLPILTLHAKTA